MSSLFASVRTAVSFLAKLAFKCLLIPIGIVIFLMSLFTPAKATNT